ncbi:MAG TPA: sensor domain-containing protein [Phycisphaerales bacterium]|nr:sensor domain-containing protein [Phycisphaerales bacterium]
MNAAATPPDPHVRPEGATPTQAISRYLSQLAVAGVGLDPALVNDMLADAEQHLWNAVGEGVPVEQAVAEFGEPRDVVAGYVQAESLRGRGRKAEVPLATIAGGQVVSAAPAPRKRGLEAVPVVGIWADRYAWGSLVLFIAGFALATAYFAVVVSWASLSLGTIAMIIGLPLLVALLGFCRVLALGHGRVIEVLTGVRMPRRTAPVAGTGMASFWGRIVLWLKDARSWLSVAYLLGNFPVAVALFTVFVSLVSTSAALMFAPIAELFMPDEWFESGNGFHFLGWEGGRMPAALGVLSFLLGLVMATGTLWLAKGSGWLYAQVAKAIQVSRPVPAVPVQVG